VTVKVSLICLEGLKLRQTNSFEKIFYMEANETVVVTIRIDEEELTPMCNEGEDLNIDFRTWTTKKCKSRKAWQRMENWNNERLGEERNCSCQIASAIMYFSTLFFSP
jgi:3-isopropylmalate dehydratase small subunit